MYKLVIVDDELEILNGLSQFFPWESIGFHVVAHMDSANRAFEYIKKTQLTSFYVISICP